MIFPLVPLIFRAKPRDVFFTPRARRFYARACARGEPTRARTRKWCRSVSAVEEPHDLATIGMYGERKRNARCPCTLQSTVETFGEEISAEACSGKEIAGLLRKIMMMMMNMMTRKL